MALRFRNTACWLTLVFWVLAADVVAVAVPRGTASLPSTQGVEAMVAMCRRSANGIRREAAECRAKLASGKYTTCDVQVTYRNGTRRYAPAAADALAARFDREASLAEMRIPALRQVEAGLRGAQDAVRALGFGKTARDLEMWETLSEKAKAELEKQTIDALLSNALLGAKAASGAVFSVTPKRAEEMIRTLRKARVSDRKLNKRIRALVTIRDKARKAKAWGDFIEGLGRLKDGIIAEGVDPKAEAAEKSNTKLAALATVLGWAVKNSRASLYLTLSQSLASFLYAGTAIVHGSATVEQLTKLTENQLKLLRLLSKRVRDATTDVKRAVARIPICGELE